MEVKNKQKEKSEKVKTTLVLLSIYALQTSFLFCLFYFFKEYFGYICLASLVLHQIMSMVFNNLHKVGSSPVIRAILALVGGGFIVIVRSLFGFEKKGEASRSVIQRIFFIVQSIIVISLFYAWMIKTPIYALITVAANAVVSAFVLISKKELEEKISSVILIWLLFGYGYLIFVFSRAGLYFIGFNRRYRKMKRELLKDNDGLENLPYDSAKYFPTGKQFFESVKECITEAKKSIFVEFFIYESGELYDMLSSVLMEKAKAGVDVRIIYDDLGTRKKIVDNEFAELKASGVKILPYNPVCPLVNTMLQYRDHRKNIVVDSTVAFVGGVNVSDEYVNKKKLFGYWKDAGVRVDGEAVAAFDAAFCCQWYAICGERIERKALAHSVASDGKILIPYFDGVYGKLCKDIYSKCIDSAKEELTIITPYFVTDVGLRRLIKKKAQEGVLVTLIIPGACDKAYVDVITRANAEALIEYGVKVFRMNNSFTHSKVILTESFAAVGSANFDYQSFNRSSECGVVTSDKDVMTQIKEDIECVLKVSTQVDENNGIRKYKWGMLASRLNRIIAILM